jgi:hypothetical protein
MSCDPDEALLANHFTEIFYELSLHPKWLYDLVKQKFLMFVVENRSLTKYRPPNFEQAYNVMVARKFEQLYFDELGDISEINDMSNLYLQRDPLFYGNRNSVLEKWAPIPLLTGNYLREIEDNVISYPPLPSPITMSNHKLFTLHEDSLDSSDTDFTTSTDPVWLEEERLGTPIKLVSFHNDRCICDICFPPGKVDYHSRFNEKDTGDNTINAPVGRTEIADVVHANLARPESILSTSSKGSFIPEQEFVRDFNYVQTVNYTTAGTVGQILYSTKLNPSAFPGTHLEYLSKIFLYFDGSFSFHLSLTSTDYHAGKLMFVHIPDPNYNAQVNNSLQFFSQYSMQIIDVRENQSVDIDIPWVSTQKALYIDSPIAEFNNTGYFLIVIYSPLNAPDTVSPIVPINIMVKPQQGCHFMSKKNVPSAVIGGAPLGPTAIASSLLAPTPINADVNYPIENLCIAGNGGPGPYNFLVADSPPSMNNIMESLKTQPFKNGQTNSWAIVPSTPFVDRNGFTYKAPMDPSNLNIDNSVNIAPLSIITDNYITASFISSMTDFSQLKAGLTPLSADGVYMSSAAVTGATSFSWKVPVKGRWCIQGMRCNVVFYGTTNVALTACLNAATPNAQDGFCYCFLTVFSTNAVVGINRVQLINEIQGINSQIYLGMEDEFVTYNSQVQSTQSSIILQQTNPIYYAPNVLTNTGSPQITNRGWSFVTGAIMDLFTPNEDGTPPDAWGTIYNFVVDAATTIGKVYDIGSTIVEGLSFFIRADRMVFDMRGTGPKSIKYTLDSFNNNLFNMNNIAPYLTASAVAQASSDALVAYNIAHLAPSN